MRRFNIFSENLKKYEEHNKSGASWTMGVNQFSDLTEGEFEAFHMGGYKVGQMVGVVGVKWLIFCIFKKTPIVTSSMEGLTVKRAKDLPESVDWRDKGAVSDVKDQGHCGSCWAFCATEMIESYAAINTGNLPTLSSQQVTSCTPNICVPGSVVHSHWSRAP